MNKYKNSIISDEIWYDEDAKLWYCYIGSENKRYLFLTVWGKTESLCKENAKELLEILSK